MNIGDTVRVIGTSRIGSIIGSKQKAGRTKYNVKFMDSAYLMGYYFGWHLDACLEEVML